MYRKRLKSGGITESRELSRVERKARETQEREEDKSLSKEVEADEETNINSFSPCENCNDKLILIDIFCTATSVPAIDPIPTERFPEYVRDMLYGEENKLKEEYSVS